MKNILLATTALTLLSLTLLSPAAAQESADVGAAAKKAYDDGDAKEAARRYRVLLDTRGESADLLFNLGTAWGESGELGHAIWALEKARLLAPGDEDVKTNLKTVRERIRVKRVEDSVGKMTEGESDAVTWWRLMTAIPPLPFAALVLLCNLLGFAALIARRGMKQGGARDATTVFAILFLSVFAVGLCGLFAQSSVHANTHLAIVLKPKQELHRSPTPNAQHKIHPDVYEGALLEVLEQRDDGWVQVLVLDQTEGWIRADDLGMLH